MSLPQPQGATAGMTTPHTSRFRGPTSDNSAKPKQVSVSSTTPSDEADAVCDTTPTEDDLRQLQRVPGKLPWQIYSIFAFELIKHISYDGSLIVFTNFVQQPLPPGSTTGAGHGGQSGALGLGQRASSGVTLYKMLLMGLMPLPGALIADQYLGRYLTLQYSNLFDLLGHAVLVVSALPPVIAHTKAAFFAFLFGIFCMTIGFGGYRPNLVTLLAEQIPDQKLKVVVDKSGRRLLEDSESTRALAIIYFQWVFNIGAAIGMIGMVWAEKYVGFWLAFTVPLILFALCPFILAFHRKSYIMTPPEGSVLIRALRLCSLSMKGRWSWNPVRMYRNCIRDPEFWTRVKPSNVSHRPSWMTFDDSWVDEVARAIRACRVFIWYPLYWPTLRSMGSNLASQAATMNLMGMPNDMLFNLNPLSYFFLVPIYAHFIYPGLARLGFRVTPIRRITAGFLFSALAMATAAIVQHFVYTTNPCGKYANSCLKEHHKHSHLPVWVQFPIYFLTANSEILAVATGFEYANSQAPNNMRSMITALFICTGMVGAGAGQLLIPLAEDPFLVWNYAVAAGFSLVACVGVFWSNRGEAGDKEAKGIQTESEPEEKGGEETMKNSKVVEAEIQADNAISLRQ